MPWSIPDTFLLKWSGKCLLLHGGPKQSRPLQPICICATWTADMLQFGLIPSWSVWLQYFFKYQYLEVMVPCHSCRLQFKSRQVNFIVKCVAHSARYWQTTLWQTIQKTKLVVPTCKQPSCQIQVGFVGQGSHWQSYFLLQGLLGYGPVGSCCSAGLCPSSVNQNMRTKLYVFESQPKQRKGSMCACVCVNNVNCYHSNHHAAWSKAF